MEKYLEILPEEICNKIIIYYSHPIADLFKKGFEEELHSHFMIDDEIDWSEDDDFLFAYRHLSRRDIRNKFAKINRRCECWDYMDMCICCDRLG